MAISNDHCLIENINNLDIGYGHLELATYNFTIKYDYLRLAITTGNS